MGERPITPDASAFGLSVNILWCPIESPLEEHLGTFTNLTAFCERVKERYHASPQHGGVALEPADSRRRKPRTVGGERTV